MFCPKCGAPCDQKQTSCEQCGIVFARYSAYLARKMESDSAPPPSWWPVLRYRLTPSPATQSFLWSIAILSTIWMLWSNDSTPDIPAQAPNFSLTDLHGDKLVLDEMRGQVVVVNFWASWCGPCKAEIPDFSRFAQEHPEISVLGIAVDSGDTGDVQRSAQRLGIDYTVALADHNTLRSYDISAFPTTVIVDPSGDVAHVQVGVMGYRDLTSATKQL